MKRWRKQVGRLEERREICNASSQAETGAGREKGRAGEGKGEGGYIGKWLRGLV